MREEEILTVVLVEEVGFTLQELARACTVSDAWVLLHVDDGLLTGSGDPAAGWRFSDRDLWRARRMWAIERDFDAVPELAALVVDLQEEVAALRARLGRAGLADL